MERKGLRIKVREANSKQRNIEDFYFGLRNCLKMILKNGWWGTSHGRMPRLVSYQLQ